MGCRKRYKCNEIGPCAIWGQKVGSSATICVLADLDPRTGEIRQVFTLLFHFGIFGSEFYGIPRILKIYKHIVEMLTFP